MSARFPIDDLVELLTWRGDGAAEARILDAHRERLAAAFDAVARGGWDRHGLLAGQFRALPEASRERFLTAPETACRLFFVSGDVKFLLAALCAEARLLDERATLPADVWTAVGDWYFPRRPATAEVAGDFAPDRPYRAPTLGNGIPVDLTSPWARRRPNHPVFKSFFEFAPDDARRAIAVVDDAMDKVARACPASDRLNRLFVKTIILERHGEGTRVFTSYSHDCFVGRTTIRFSDDRCDEVEIADSLVHEAIHAPLYIVARAFPFIRKGIDPAHTIRSPWSGRDLDPDSFAHAVFVWFGLRQFWRKAVLCELFPGEEAGA
jgi:HEXXH motif-containing protein